MSKLLSKEELGRWSKRARTCPDDRLYIIGRLEDHIKEQAEEIESLRDLLKAAYQISIVNGRGMEAKHWEHFGGIIRAALNQEVKGE